MGRRYYCNYCDKSFVETPDSVKKHRNGVLHQKLLKEHYQQFKDFRTILNEECLKNPCNRFQKTGECAFGLNCRYSHYTKEQLDYMRWEVEKTKCNLYDQSFINTNLPTLETWFYSRRERGLINSNALEKLFTNSLSTNSGMITPNVMTPWKYPDNFDNMPDIPPSLRKINVVDLTNVEFKSWG